METTLSQASQLKPSIRLNQAISNYENSLNSDDKARFEALRKQQPPTTDSVMVLTAEISRAKLGRASQLAPRLTQVLSTIRVFTGLVDLVVSGSQNLIASSVWGVLKTALESAARSSDFFDKLSNLLMQVGRQSLDVSEYAGLYTSDLRLQDSLCEYLIAVVDLCKEAIAFIGKSRYSRTVKSFGQPFESVFGRHQQLLQQSCETIDRQARLASTRDQKEEIAAQQSERRETTLMRTLQSKFSSEMRHELAMLRVDRRNRAKARLLRSCTDFSPMSTWRRQRKWGNTEWIFNQDAYQEWKDAVGELAILYCYGPLGSGKTVIAANVIDDVTLNKRPGDLVTYHFYCFDNTESRSAQVIFASIARQILDQGLNNDSAVLDSVPYEKSFSEDEILGILENYVPSTLRNGSRREIYIILDGLNRASQHKQVKSDLFPKIFSLSKLYCLKLFVTNRFEGATNVGPAWRRWHISILNCRPTTDIADYIADQLHASLECGDLSISDPNTIVTVAKLVQKKSKQMFLWVHYQMQEICRQHSDDSIVKCLKEIPNDLVEIYSTVMRSCSAYSFLHVKDDNIYQRTLHLVSAAEKNLTVDQIREALSIEPGVRRWDPRRLPLNMQKTITDLNGLLMIDEEDLTVRFAHESVLQFFQTQLSQVYSEKTSSLLIGEICVTYMGLENLKGAVGQKLKTEVNPSDILRSTVSEVLPPELGWANKAAMAWLKPPKGSSFDLRKQIEKFQPRGYHGEHLHHFKPYATKYWLDHTRHFALLHADPENTCPILVSLQRKTVQYLLEDLLSSHLKENIGNLEALSSHNCFEKFLCLWSNLLYTSNFQAIISYFELASRERSPLLLEAILISFILLTDVGEDKYFGDWSLLLPEPLSSRRCESNFTRSLVRFALMKYAISSFQFDEGSRGREFFVDSLLSLLLVIAICEGKVSLSIVKALDISGGENEHLLWRWIQKDYLLDKSTSLSHLLNPSLYPGQKVRLLGTSLQLKTDPIILVLLTRDENLFLSVAQSINLSALKSEYDSCIEGFTSSNRFFSWFQAALFIYKPGNADEVFRTLLNLPPMKRVLKLGLRDCYYFTLGEYTSIVAPYESLHSWLGVDIIPKVSDGLRGKSPWYYDMLRDKTYVEVNSNDLT